MDKQFWKFYHTALHVHVLFIGKLHDKKQSNTDVCASQSRSQSNKFKKKNRKKEKRPCFNICMRWEFYPPSHNETLHLLEVIEWGRRVQGLQHLHMTKSMYQRQVNDVVAGCLDLRTRNDHFNNILFSWNARGSPPVHSTIVPAWYLQQFLSMNRTVGCSIVW